jgi:hypothetical protein
MEIVYIGSMREKSWFDSTAVEDYKKLQTTWNYPTQITLREMPIGARLLVRSKKDWRVAVVSQFYEEKATLIVCSPSAELIACAA